jgi:hypothetical protein
MDQYLRSFNQTLPTERNGIINKLQLFILSESNLLFIKKEDLTIESLFDNENLFMVIKDYSLLLLDSKFAAELVIFLTFLIKKLFHN